MMQISAFDEENENKKSRALCPSIVVCKTLCIIFYKKLFEKNCIAKWQDAHVQNV